MSTRYLPDSLFDGDVIRHNVAIVVENGAIVALAQPTGGETRLSGMLAPGFIDVQVNGGGGVLFNSTTTVAGLSTIIETHSRYGTCGMMPTLITDSVEVMQQAADAMSEAIAAKVPGILGIHFEGPHLSVEKKGVHSTAFIRRLSDQEKAIFSRQDLGLKMVTLAPENVAPEDIHYLAEIGVRVCLGHSNATCEQTQKALSAGATGFTHLFNAMSPFTSRAPGVVGAALEDADSWCGLIVDGFHVHPSAAKVALAAKKRGKIMLVTDAMPPVGTEDTSFEFFGSSVIRSGDRLNALTGELAGSCLDMAGAVKNSVQTLDVSVEEALRMASLYPAEYLQIDDQQGRLQPGYQANFVLLDSDLTVTRCWIDGNSVYNAV
ncbi:MAG: N-acetylglucosamine-6-phosphate deacetylase [Phenylobacterium sp.]|jgi:N-acetylglucosamine-6-phosphate deacetylase